MDKALRPLLYTAVVKCRALLEEELDLQLEGVYGVHGDGRVEPLSGPGAPGRNGDRAAPLRDGWRQLIPGRGTHCGCEHIT